MICLAMAKAFATKQYCLRKKCLHRIPALGGNSPAEVSKQTFYRYYKDKYELANEIYAQLTQQGIIEPEKIQTEDDWRDMYLKIAVCWNCTRTHDGELTIEASGGMLMRMVVQGMLRYGASWLG